MQKVHWKDEHIVVVSILLLVLYCSRGICSGLVGMVDCLDKCIEKDCCCYSNMSVQLICKAFLDVYVGLNPLVVIMVYMLASQATPPRSSSVLFQTLVLNDSAPYYSVVGQGPGLFHVPMTLDLRESSVDEVDYIVCVIPFAISMTCSYVLLFRCIGVGDLSADTYWDDELFTSDTPVIFYELSYHVELLFMNISLILASNSEQSFTTLCYKALSLTLLQTYFVCSAHMSACEYDRQTGLLVMILFVLALMPVMFVIQHCVLSLVAGALFLFCVCAVALGHYLCLGKAQAKHVVVLRLLVSMVASAFHLVVLAVGRNRVCVGRV